MLTAKAINAEKRADRPRKLVDGRGLWLKVSSAGAKRWRVRYAFAGKGKRTRVGTLPKSRLPMRERSATHCCISTLAFAIRSAPFRWWIGSKTHI